jgi:dynein heavy chain
MMDILMADFMKTMVHDAMLKLVEAVESDNLDPRIECDDNVDRVKLQRKREAQNVKTPLFRIIASFRRGGQIETIEDAFQLAPMFDTLVRALDSVVNDCLDVIGTFVKVLTAPETEMYVMPTGDDDEAEAAEPEDMVSAIRNGPTYMHCRESIHNHIRSAYNAVREYLNIFEPYRQLYLKNLQNVNDIVSLCPSGDVDAFQNIILEFKDQIEQFTRIPRYADVGVMFVDSADLKEVMIPSPMNCLLGIKAYLPELINSKAQELVNEVGAMNPILSGEPTTVEAYVHKKKVKDAAAVGLEEYNNRQSYIRSLVHVMDDNGWPAPDHVKALMRMLKDSLLALETNVQLAEGKEEEETKKFSVQVTDECPKVVKKLAEVREQLDANLISDPEAQDEKVVKFLAQQELDFQKLKARIEKIQEYQGILRLPVDDFEVTEEIGSDLNLKVRLWNDRVEWGKLRNRIMETPINQLDVQLLERELTRYNKTVTMTSKGLPLNKVVPKLKASVDEVNPVLPIITDLRSPALQPRHWDQITKLVGFNILEQENFSLADLIVHGVTKCQEEISTIATAALQESILEEMMAKVTGIWEKLAFEVKPYKDTKGLYILGDTSDVIASLDDSLVTINTVLGSRYVSGIRQYVDNWRSKLMLFQETLDEWLTCQRNWMYLETIFSSPDIIRQLPVPAKTFQAVDKSWRLIMKSTFDEPNALKAATHDRNRRDVFRNHNANLDQIQKDLEDYLETKRAAFPRFYFLSNDELLEILSQSKDPRAVQPHLRKCFDNLVKLEFGPEPGSLDILAMISSEGEKVGLGKNLKVKGNVEEWLNLVTEKMKASLRIAMKAGLLDYDTKAREEWIFHHPGQVVATVAQMTWARGTEQALRSSNPIQEMNLWSDDYKAELQKLIVKIRGTLPKLVRMIIVALVTTDVHARDIIDELCERQVQNIHDFLWQQQLRYYWETDVDDCVIRHSDARVAYGYEYMGATSRLVITPLTDRCWLTLTGSYALKLGAAPAGPAGTGKTESSKDLAKAMGIQCVVFNCSDQIDYKMMGKLFRGLAQGGSWICLDEFNRIDIEVLSVIAQQLLVLREGRQAQKSSINFMGVQIRLMDHHVIITMNPGYAGRTELPDNLQVCFRPVSMMVPNYALIAEIMLFAEGFGDAKNLSRKMCKLYILCSEQLSQQPHYDYGLRAVKSVLVMAGGLKRSNPDKSEELVLIRALRDSNVPKFLADDLPLFAAIVQDLFPGVVIPDNDYGELQVALEEEIVKAGLQKVPKFINKVIQMFDIFNIRFGATLVGPAGTGKTTVYRILAALMTNLREKGSRNPEFQKVRFQILNPKCITMGELYGEFNPLTQEWHDGLASSIMREFVAEESDDKRWTIFDGPIDALWIENMNTVLDDNMTLCLANGQRIKLKAEMKCLFEVNDLAVASPATVSRIGVVYLTPSDLGWMPFAKSWSQRALPSNCPVWAKERIMLLFEKPFTKGLAYQRKFGKEPVETVDIQLVISMCYQFQTLFSAENGVNFSAQQTDLQPILDKLFFFSYVWSVGATCADTFWEQFTENAREIFEEICPGLGLPGGGTAFDYYVDAKEGRFREWKEIVPSFRYDETVPYFSLIVPTTDTCRFSYIMKSLIQVDKPCFITGVTGTGKTVAVQSLLNSLQPMPFEGGMGILPIFMNFSAQTKSEVTQITIESKLEKKRKNLLGPPSGRKGVIFVDDVNMPLVETYGAQPPVELLRQFLDFKGFYDRDKLFWKDIQDVLMFVGAAPPGGGRSPVTGRFTRHFNVLCFPPASEGNLTTIFSSILSGFLIKFEPEIQKMVSGTVAATIEVYAKISQELLPTPAKFHYTFNLRDISKVFQGILMIRSRKCNNADTFSRLWVHETMRIFYDRLINSEDQQWFQKLMVELLSRHMRMSVSQEDLFAKPIVFADFLRPDADPRFYEEIKDLVKLTTVLNDLLDNYNMSFPTQMNLVFFEDALTHTARISRILRQPRGNAMLIGVGGSGKQSLTRMAAFVANMQCVSIEINRGYGINEFREDIKKFMFKTGVEGKDIVFLFTDSQIVDETMLEDLNNVLNTGEVSNLFAQDETDKIVGDMNAVCKAAGIPETRDNCLSFFVSRVRDKLHIVLCMSPVGDALRIRCRQFPSLINCTTIDWFHGWPEAALVSVAERFLGDLELPSEDIRKAVVRMCGSVHRSIEDTSVKFYNELRRRIYTTPKSYLDLINLYMSMLKGLQDVVEIKSDRMKVGVRKLNETNSVVDGLKADLVALEPILREKAVETEALLIDVAKQKAEANVVAEKVAQEEAIVGKQAAETAAIAADAQKDLDRALPALQSAEKALASLTKADITEVKSFTNPPLAVKTVMEAVCTLLGEKGEWDNAKKILGRPDLMDMLINFDKDNIPESRLKKLRKNYLGLEEMQLEVVQKVSSAGYGLCSWVRAMDVYADVAKDVAPKKARLAEMNDALAITTAQLKEKQAQLKAVMDRVAALQKTCDETLAEKNRLQQESDTTAKRLERAEKLTSGLSSEGERWKTSIEELALEKVNLIGDCFLSCACISYYGGFTGTYRDDLIHRWLQKAQKLGIPASSKFSLTNTLGDPVQIREWQNQGLPTDPVSVNNGILVDKCRRWPLMIDPQMQANVWIRKKEESNGVVITTMRDPNLLRALENCIRLGKPLLLEDVGEQIEPALEPVLQKAVFKNGSRMLIRLGDSDVDYDSNFRLYMTTKLPNPHYLPEVSIKVTIINFTVTMLGLEQQLLGQVVATEAPELEARRVKLMLAMADYKRQLLSLEAKILQLLSESEGNILDDEVLINTLSDSKRTSITISERVAEAEVTELDINEKRSRYLEVATRGSIIYFVIADLATVDPMYQYSLAYYKMLFQRCIDDSERPSNGDVDVRIHNIIDYATLIIYQNICRGLFEKDKILFSSSICFQILRQGKEIGDGEWNLFIRGPGSVDRASMPANPFPEIISPPMWDIICAAEKRLIYRTPQQQAEAETAAASADAGKKKKKADEDDVPEEAMEVHEFSHPTPFVNLAQSLNDSFAGRTQESAWLTWMTSPNLITAPLPGDLQTTVNDFQRLILVKALREDKLQQSIANFVALKLGAKFAESPSTSMDDIYKDLDNKTPCIFVLSTGADPTGMLLRFAKKSNYADRLHIVSLGQGQGPYAKELIDRGTKTGDWVILQNCMLAKSWMPELDRIIFELQERAKKEDGGGVHPDFRLYLTSAPATYFPVSILQNGVKMTNEPPKGFRANLLRSFGNLVKEDDYESMAKSLEWKKLLVGLVFFHANIQERRKFGPLGWNIRYAFDESDLETSMAVLKRFLTEQELLPWDALNYVTGQINYGGRVTDDWDRRCLMSVLSIYMVPEILEDKYRFSASGTYYAPPIGNVKQVMEYFEQLPLSDDPEVFGMHDNANVTFNTNESLALMAALLALQPRSSGGGSGKTSDDVVIELANAFESRCPALLLDDEAGPTTFVIQPNGLLTSLAICLAQEMVKFNRLLKKMTSSMSDLKKAIKGMIVMSSDLDAMYTSFLNNQLPGNWETVSFASLKTLGSWVTDLIYRVGFMRAWLQKGQPHAFPLPVFFFPQGFMTASLQTYARKHMEAIDGLSFKYQILTQNPEEITESPEDGVIVFGLYLEGARFDRELNRVVESKPGEMYDLLPAIHFQPSVNHKQAPGTYACPVYKTAVRKGVLSTTGMSTNYVVPVELPIRETDSEQKWILAGVAALCNLTD